MHELQPFHIMAKPRGPICNLACNYCYYLEKKDLYPESNFRMTREVLESYIHQTIAAHPGPELTFSWQGGEPTLMGLQFFENVIQIQNQHKQPGKQFVNAFQTNGIVLNSEWCRFFKDNNFLVGISLDGPPALHNADRKTNSGYEKFDKVLRAVNLLKKYQVNFNILCCVHQANVHHPLEVYPYLRDTIGAEFIQFIPIVQLIPDPHHPGSVTPSALSVSGLDYGKFLQIIFDTWIQQDVGKVFVQIFDVALGVWVGQPASLCIFAETCGQAMALEHNGDLYACDHFVTPEYLIGNITESPLVDLIRCEQQAVFGQNKQLYLPEKCLHCDVRFICNGGCPKNRDQQGLNHLCEGYQLFFRHIDQPMQTMTNLLKNRRAPAEIMQQYEPINNSHQNIQ